MMINPYANFVIQKMLVTAEEQQVVLLLDVARNNVDNLKRYPHGRHVIAAVEKFLSAKGMVWYIHALLMSPVAECW
jgi:pumilio RNA-binding family